MTAVRSSDKLLQTGSPKSLTSSRVTLVSEKGGTKKAKGSNCRDKGWKYTKVRV